MESSENIYYAENAEVVEENNTWGMENVVIVGNENLSWQENSSEVTINYADATENPEQTITENEIYISANAENSLETSIDADKSEYYSILDTTYQAESEDCDEQDSKVKIIVQMGEDEQILPDSQEQNVQIEETDGKDDQSESDTGLEGQVFLYHTEDTDEMYAVQIADDGNGNLQRYKYKVRQNADGQLEAIPGTIEVQVDDIIEKHLSEQAENVIQEPETIKNYKVEQEEDTIEKAHENAEHSTEVIETAQENEEEMPMKTYEDTNEEEQHHEEELERQVEEEEAVEYEQKPDLIEIKQELMENINTNGDSDSDAEEGYGTPEYLLSENEQDDDETAVNNGFETEAQTVEDDVQEPENDESSIMDQLEDKRPKFFKSKEQLDKTKVAIYPGNKKISFLLLNSVEKENVEHHNTIATIKNSRSLLKNTVLSAIEDQEIQDALNNIMHDNKIKRSSIRIINTNKSFSKEQSNDSLSENVQIVEKKKEIAEKSVRQPRKQTITPIQRNDSEIIVQPVFYSFHDEEPLLVPVKRKYNKQQFANEVVRVSDVSESDDETLGTKAKKLKKQPKKSKQIEQITISDTETSDTESIIEILTEKSTKKSKNNALTVTNESETETETEKFDDITKIQEAVNNIVQEREQRKNKIEKPIKNQNSVKTTIKLVKKNNIKCPKCPKTFPREINLKTHMNIHNARRSLRGKEEVKTNATEKTTKEVKPKSALKALVDNSTKKQDKFYCSRCKLKFMTEIQLKRHLSIHKDIKIPAMTPKKRLELLRKTNASPLRVRKSIAKPLVSDRKPVLDTKNVMSSPRRPFKCDQCTLSFSQKTLLASHKLKHKQFPCTKCNINFSSKLLLDEHLKKKCNKLLPEVAKRKSIVPKSPMKNSRFATVFHSCTTCKLRFRTVQSLKEHEKIHKKLHEKSLSEVKSNLAKNVNTRSKRPHGGVPTSERMQRAFDLMKLVKS